MLKAITAVALATVLLSGCVAAGEPPGGTLSSEGRTVTGLVGSYCWYSRCVDGGFTVDEAGFRVPPGKKALAVDAGSGMIFGFEGRDPSSVRAEAYPLNPATDPSSPGDARPLRPEQGATGRKLRVGGADERTRISVNLPPGEYVVDVFAQVPQGDATYAFHVSVGT